jgi:hypothetical protein
MKKATVTGQFVINRSLYEDAKYGWVWVSEPGNKEYAGGDFILITSPEGHSIVTECRIIDTFYEKKWSEYNVNFKKNRVFINYVYRKKLKIKAKSIVDLRIVKVNSWRNIYWKFLQDHPDGGYRTSSILALVSVILGIIGILFGVLGIILTSCI